MKTAMQLCLAAVFATTLLGQGQPRDVEGWGKIKWGMTSNQASQAYVINRHEDNELWSELIAEPLEFYDFKLRVAIGARHGSDQISRVRLWDNSAGTEEFDTLKTLLIQKYGPPIDADSRSELADAVRTFLWTFPSTTIRLTLRLDQKAQGRSALEYLATDQRALDAL
jgi:hypothetical protein